MYLRVGTLLLASLNQDFASCYHTCQIINGDAFEYSCSLVSGELNVGILLCFDAMQILVFEHVII